MFAFWLLSLLANGQQRVLDSLEQRLSGSDPPTQILVLNQIAKLHSSQSPKKSIEYAQRAKLLAQQSNNHLGMAVASNLMAEYYLSQGDYATAHTQIDQALRAAKLAKDSLNIGVALAKAGATYFFQSQLDSAIRDAEGSLLYLQYQSPSDYATALNLISYIFSKRNQYLKAIQYHIRALEIRKKLGNDNDIAKSYNSLGDFYVMQGNMAKAIEYYYASLVTSKKMGNQKGEAISLNNIGFVQTKQGNYKEAAQNLHRALVLKKQWGNKKEVAISLYNLGVLNAQTKHYDSALFFLNQSLKIRQNLQDKLGTATTLTAIGKVYSAQGNFTASLNYHQSAITIAENSLFKLVQAECYAGMAEVYLSMNKPKEFMDYFKRQQAIQDTLDVQINSAKIADLLEKLEQDRQLLDNERAKAVRELDEAEKRRQQVIIFSLTGFATLLFLLALLLYRFYRLRSLSSTALEERNRKIMAQNAQLSASEGELKKLNEAKDRFFSIVAHDVRSPMASLNGLLKVYQDTEIAMSREESSALVGEISHQLDNVTILLNDLLHWARNQMTQVTFRPELLSIGAITKKIVGLLSLDASAKRIGLHENIAIGFNVFADPNMLDFILRNLVANAIKFTPIGGQISISAELQGAMIEVAVSDNGLGISEEKLGEIFDPLKRSPSTGTAGETGSGLGLSLCKEFVERHGGQIGVRPNVPQGLIFTFSLPRAGPS